MSASRHGAPSLRRHVGAAVAVAAALLLSACSGPAASESVSGTATTSSAPRAGGSATQGGSTTAVPPADGQVLAPGEVAAIVASDSAINNRANASLSIPLQDSHETCLQQVLDDATYRGDEAAGADTLGGSFDQVPSRTFVPRETGYPAFFSVLAENRVPSEPTTTNFLTYVKTSAAARWKLASSSEILGSSGAGAALPAAATDAEGYVTSLAPAATDGLEAAPDKVAARVAAAFSAEAASGKLPAEISAQFGPGDEADPHSIASSFASVGAATTKFSATPPAAAAAGAPSPDCPSPAFRLSDGGALVSFAVFSQIVVHVRSGSVIIQPLDRSAFGVLLPPGTYSSITLVVGDMGVVIVPPSGSRSPIDVIGQASEGLTETGVRRAGSANSNASGGPGDASLIAKGADPGIVDINTTLSYENEKAAGSGMVLTSDGEVLTNNHVIEGATSISVTDVGNRRTYAAKVVGYDRTSDVAVLRLENAAGLHTITRGNSSRVRIGEAVVGIGNAAGRGGTPSYAGGAVTALHQHISASDVADGTSENLTGLIETNAEIEPGDSGGPLVTGNGKVVGMDTAASAGFEFQFPGSPVNESFSVPINEAIGLADRIVSSRSSAGVHIGPTAFLGVRVESPAAASHSGFGSFGGASPGSSTQGAQVAEIVAGSPAARAGLAVGDTITSLGGESVTSSDALTTIIENARPGASAKLVYVDSNGAHHTVTVQLASGPPQ